MLPREAALAAGVRRWTTSWHPCLRSAKGLVGAGVDSVEEEGSPSALAAEASRVPGLWVNPKVRSPDGSAARRDLPCHLLRRSAQGWGYGSHIVVGALEIWQRATQSSSHASSKDPPHAEPYLVLAATYVWAG